MDDSYRAVSLPFKGRRARLLLVQGDCAMTAEELSETLTYQDYQQILDGFVKLNIELYVPKFTHNAEARLIHALSDMGFPASATITAFDKPLNMAFDVKQCVSTKIDEDGATAAASTVVGGFGAPQADIWVFDRPFLYFICDDVTGVILMAGRICNL